MRLPVLPRRQVTGLLCLALLLLGCGDSTSGGAPSGGKTPVKLVLNWVADPEFGGFYAARESGAFKDAGLEVELVTGGAGVPVVQMVASGQAQFGISGADEILTARARGADVIPLFAVFQTSPQAIMVHASRGVKNIPELLASGGVLALEAGLPYAAFLKKKYGFDRTKIVPYDGGLGRFLAEKDFAQQCFITSEPLSAKKQGGDPVTFLIADEGFNPYLVVAITRRELWNKSPDLVRSFRKAALAGWRTYLDNPGPTNTLISKLNPTLTADALPAISDAQKPLIETAETRSKGLGTMSRERWEQIMNQLVDLKILDSALPLDELLVAAE